MKPPRPRRGAGKKPGRESQAARPSAPASETGYLKLGTAVLWLLILLPPVWLATAAKDNFRQPKLLLSGLLGLASLLALAWGVRRLERIDLAAFFRAPVVRALLPCLVVATAGLAWTRHPVYVKEGLTDLWIGAACLAGWALAVPAQRLGRLLSGLLVPAGLLAVLGLLQAHQLWEPLAVFYRFESGERFAMTSTAGNPADLGIYLVLPCLVAQWMLTTHDRRRPAFWAAGLGLLICVYAVARTQTLSALAALVLGSAVFWWVLLPRRKALLGAAAGLLAAAVLVAAVGPLRARLGGALELARSGEINTLLSGRLDGWRAAVLMLREHPVTGVGHGAFLPEFAPAKLKLLDRGVPFYAGHVQPMFANAHNELLDVGAEWGIPGLLALAWGLWLLGRELRRGGPPREDRALAWAGAAALAVVALTYFPFRTALIAYPALIFLAWVFARARSEEAA